MQQPFFGGLGFFVLPAGARLIVYMTFPLDVNASLAPDAAVARWPPPLLPTFVARQMSWVKSCAPLRSIHTYIQITRLVLRCNIRVILQLPTLR